MILVTIKVRGNPGFRPDQLDVDAPPPPGTIVDIDGTTFVVDVLTLRSRVQNERRRTYYEVTLKR